MGIQYFIVAAIVVVVLIWQYKTYKENASRIDSIKNLFPSKDTTVTVIEEDGTTYLRNDSANAEFKSTLEDINKYLVNNKNKTYDYHILKEIVDRNSQSLEDEVDTMLTVPLYWGLIATIFGIAFGIVMFAWKDLANLLGGSNMNPEGIKILLTDVGIAMIASLAGVYFTKESTSKYNTARTNMVKNKNKFLTWIQSDLMSKLSDDLTGALVKMTQDLNEFNRTFASNTRELKETLSTVKNNYEGQVKLLETIDKIKINKIAKANIEIYDKLQGCTEELENLFEIFANSETYVAKVVELNEKIGSIEERTQLFEELGNYFKNEIEFVRDRQGLMRQQMSGIDSVLQDALSNLGDSLTNSISNLTTTFHAQNQQIQLLIEEQQASLAQSLEQQQNAVNEKIGQIDNPFEGLKETFEEGIRGIQAAFNQQNEAIKEAMATQKTAIENAMNEQQRAIVRKLQETLGQLQAISDLSKVLDRLNKTLTNPNIMGVSGHVNSVNTEGEVIKSKSVVQYLKRNFMPICACGSFISLLILILLKIFGI